MTNHSAKIVFTFALVLASCSALSAQDGRPRLEVGVWSGDLTPMHHPDRPTPLRFGVSEVDGSPSIEIQGPDGLVLPTHGVTASEAGVTFSFSEPEAEVLLQCDLRFDRDGVLVGRCADPDGKWASLTMRPPTGGVEGGGPG